MICKQMLSSALISRTHPFFIAAEAALRPTQLLTFGIQRWYRLLSVGNSGPAEPYLRTDQGPNRQHDYFGSVAKQVP